MKDCYDENCVFCNIIAGKIPSKKMYEDGEMLIFQDIEPKAKIHLLLVPKQHFPHLADLDDERAALVGRCLKKLGEIYRDLGLGEGYRVVINQGENAGQTVPHLHLHLLGGESMPW